MTKIQEKKKWNNKNKKQRKYTIKFEETQKQILFGFFIWYIIEKKKQ